MFHYVGLILVDVFDRDCSIMSDSSTRNDIYKYLNISL